MTSTNLKLRKAIKLALSAGAVSVGIGAMSSVSAQQPAPGDQLEMPVEEVVVTGTRILRQDFEATSPVFTLSRDMFADAGTPQIEQVLNDLPQLVPSITTTSNNPSLGGQAIVDLRGLGGNEVAPRTLVLLDGLRMQPSTTSGQIDLNTIPAALIESVEIMTGGGSAAYGSDAIAGVVNVRLRRDFEGVEFSAFSSVTGEGDGLTNSASILVGGNFADDRGNAVLVLSWDDREEIFAGDRRFSEVAFGPQMQPLGSTSIPEGYYVVDSTNMPSQAAFDQVFGQFGAGAGEVPNTSWVGFNPDSSVFSREGTFNFQGDTTDPGFDSTNYTYNYSPVNYLQLPLERRQLAAFGHYALAPEVEVYSRLFYTTYSAANELAPTPISAGVGTTMPMDNPFIPDDLRTLLESRPNPDEPFVFNKRTAEVGSRRGTNDYDVAQMLVGARGDFQLMQRDWGWDVAAYWGRTNRTEWQTGNVSRSRLQAAYDDPINPGELGGGPGAILEAAGCAGEGGLNPFGAGVMSEECAAAIAIQAQNVTVLTSQGAVAAITGSLADLPAGPLQTAFGVEHRQTRGDFRPDEFLASGDVVGFNAQQPVSGSIDVDEAFVEFAVPLMAGAAGVDYLGLDVGYRYSNYNLAGSVNTYMAGLEYQPVEQVRLRGSYQRAIRAPSVFNLFRPQSEGFPRFEDPCWNNSSFRTGAQGEQVEALCAAQGVGANFPQGNTQVRTLTGGNPDLEPESADTYTFGVVWQPPQLGRGQLRMATDWFRYEMDDVIGSVGAASIISRCFNDQGANPTFDPNNEWCQLFQRSPAGIAEDVSAFDENLGRRNVEGIDLQVDYRLPVGPGNMDLNLALTRLLNWEQQEDPLAPLTSQAGTIGVLVAETFPDWKGVLGVGYALDNYDLRWTVRYVDSMDVVNADASRSPVVDGVRPRVSSYTNHRLTARWRPNDAWSLMLGIDNLFDQDPPIYTNDATAGIQANTDPSTYDVRGRRYFLSASFGF